MWGLSVKKDLQGFTDLRLTERWSGIESALGCAVDSNASSPVNRFGTALGFARQPVLGSTVTFASLNSPSRHATLQHRIVFNRRHCFFEKRELPEPYPWLNLSFRENILRPTAGSASRATWARRTQAPSPSGGVAGPQRRCGDPGAVGGSSKGGPGPEGPAQAAARPRELQAGRRPSAPPWDDSARGHGDRCSRRGGPGGTGAEAGPSG